MTQDSRAATAGIAVALILVTVSAFLPIRYNDFILYDDPEYITGNPQVRLGLTSAGLAWAFTATAAHNWHPLTWIAHMFDVELFGMNAAAHHLSGVALHALTTVFLFLVLAAATGQRWRSALVAALFALHPLRVESVAWASEKKDLLGGLFWVLTLGAYLRYAHRPGARRYLAVIICFALGLMAKPMLVTLPLVLLLCDWWPLGRAAPHLGRGPHPGCRSVARLLAEKIPFLALAAAAGAITFLVQRESEAVKGFDLIPFVPRLLNAALSYGRYLGKTIWPFGLSPFYPHLGPDLPLGASLLALSLLLALTLALRGVWKNRPWLAVGWLWYLGTLLPVIGIIQVGWQALADRYTYLPLIGIFLACVWEAGLRTGTGRRRWIFVVAALLLLAGLGALTRRQTGFWRDSVSVFTRAVAVTPDNMMAEYLLGRAQRLAGNPEAADRHLRAAIRINPRFPGIHTELGLVLFERGDLEGAARAYLRDLQLESMSAATHNNLGYTLARLGQPERALQYLEAALRIDPHYARAHFNAGMVLSQLRREAEAAEHFRAAAREEGNNTDLRTP